MITWLVIANSSKAFVYDITQKEAPGTKKPHYHSVIELSHSASRLKTSDLVSDGHGEPAPHSDAHENEFQNFAREIAHYLESERSKNSYKQLVLCAGPHFHGLLNQTLSKQTALMIKKHIEKDYIPLHTKELSEVIESICHEMCN